MGQRRHHYEAAFERYMRDRRVPFISVNEAKRALLPRGAKLGFGGDGEGNGEGDGEGDGEGSQERKLKNFDFVVYGQGTNLLVEVKGRRLAAIRLKDGTPAKPRMESWVTLADIEALSRWRQLFGPEFEPMFVFVYWCDDVPPDGLFVETLVHQERWYTLRAITLDAYVGAMKVRSEKWGTVHLSAGDYQELSRPFEAFGVGLNEPAYVGIGDGPGL